MNMEKIKEITFYRKEDEKNVSWEKASIEVDGNLRLDGYDLGETPLKFWGDDEYEYWLTVDKEWKDTILLLLAKERFEDFGSFRKWLDEKDIPNRFANWV